jgi:hypothetical protein
MGANCFLVQENSRINIYGGHGQTGGSHSRGASRPFVGMIRRVILQLLVQSVSGFPVNRILGAASRARSSLQNIRNVN